MDATFFGQVFFLVLVLFVLGVIAVSVKIVPQARAYVIERLGAYHGTWETGIHFLIPFVDRIAKKTSLKEQVIDFAPQPVITMDNVTMQIDTVVYFQITDSKLLAYGVESPLRAIENLTATTLRNIVGELELDQTLTSRDLVNTKMRTILDEATDPWGIKVNRVEVKNIMPPQDIRDAMEKQMRAERERRESILRAEGEKRSEILRAEGAKEAAILRAEADKESQVRRAEGEAEAIIKVQEANAQGIRMIKEAGADKAYLTLQSFETMKVIADGQATKIIIPSDLQGIAGLMASAAELIEKAPGSTKTLKVTE
jgi:regulator of protease activity HflC (stomatin/prohibitin superfamily)